MARRQTAAAIAIAGGLAVLVGSACKGGSSGGGGTPTGPTAGTPTVTLGAGGASPSTLRINLGQRVQFTNNDSRSHDMMSVPHLLHTDCPALNEVGVLAPGASRQTGALMEARSCGYHDHMNPDDQRFRGQIVVGPAEPTEPPY